MKKFYVILILTISVLQYCETLAQDEDLITPKDKKENIKLDTRVDNMGYWNRMIEFGVTKGNPSIPFKPAEYKGSMLNGKGIKATDSPDVPVTSATNVTETENSVFIDPNDNQYILNSNNSTSWNGSSVSTLYGANYFQSADGGASWGGSASGAGGSNSGDPTTAINSSGRQFVGYISSSGGMGVSYSDNGTSWTAVNVYSTSGQDKNHLWIDNSTSSPYHGYLYNSWVDLNSSSGNYADNIFSRSIDNGGSWLPVINISSAVNAGSHNQGVNIQTGPNGEVYVVWAIYDSWPSDETALGLAKSTNGGASFPAATRILSNIKGIRNTGVPQNMRVNSFPSMAVDISGGSNDGNVYIVWTNIGTPGVNSGTAGVYMIRSTNGGTSWSTPVKVNQGTGTSYFPWITCDSETGALAVIFYDNRNTATADAEAWVAYSTDAGNTWADMRVSDVSFTPTPISGLATGYMGDYLGITSKGGRIYPCWTDNRSSTYMTYVSPFDLGLTAAFTANNTNICAGSSVTFTDQSSGSPTLWTWSFPGGTPNSYSGQYPPTITYNTPGTYNVSLTVGDGSSTDTELKTGYIVVENIIADFSGSPTTVVVGNSVTFTDNSACSPTSWSWSFPSGTPSTASGPGPHTITYNTFGTYNVTLTVSNASYNDTETKVGYIDVINCNYCTTYYSNTTDDYISNVTFNTINNNSGSTTYTDFTSISTNITTGNTYNISANITVNGNWTQHCWAWIDWNRDCDFDDAGEGYDLGQTPGTTGTHTLSTNIAVPAGASLGSTRMRVSELYAADPGPCTVSTYGEAEDYTVVIQSSSSPPIADFTADDLTPAVGQTVNFTDQSSSSPTSWSWSFNPAAITYVGGTNSGSQNPQVQFNSGGYYTVTLVATNAYGSDSEIKANYIFAGTAGNWTGATSIDWNTASNWETLVIPTSSDNVTIPASVPNWPTYTGNLTLGTTCNDISMDGASQLTATGDLSIPAGQSFTCNANPTIFVGGDWLTQGSFDPGTGTVECNGSTNSVINVSSGSGSTILITECNQNSPDYVEIQNVSNATVNASNLLVAVSASYSDINSVNTTYWNLGTLTAGQVQYRDDNSGSGQYWGSNIFWSSGNNGWTMIIDDNTGTVVDFLAWGWTAAQIAGMNPTINGHSISIGSEWTGDGTNSTCGNTQQRQGSSDNNNASDFICQTGSAGIQNTGLTVPFPGGSFAFYNLTINKTSAEIFVNSDIEVQGNLSVMSQAFLTNNTGNTLDVLGNAYFNADASGMSSYIDNGTTTVGGNTFVEQYFTSQRWHLVSPPVSGGTINTYYDIYLKEYNEPTDTWTYLVTPTTMPMIQSQGYSAWASNAYTGTTTVTYTGTLNNTSFVVNNLDYTPAAAKAGFNLLGNPYPCALDWNNSWSMTDMSGWMVIYDNGTYRGMHTDGTPYNGKADGIIPSTQGFWVRAMNATASITIPASERVHSGQTFYKKSKEIIYPVVRLETEVNGYTDETVVIFHPEATSGYDGYYDLTKFENISEAPQLYTMTEGGNYGVNFYHETYDNEVIPVGFKTEDAGLYTITSETVSNFVGGMNIYLEDIKTGGFKQLYKGTQHSFSYDPLDEEHRFNLHFTTEHLEIEETTLSGLEIYSFGQTVYVKNPDMVSGDVIIYDMMGQTVISAAAGKSQLTAIPIKDGDGYYLVKVQSGDKLVTEKVLIR